MKKVELLSPAGNFECLKAAINNGADAVYLGGSNFSARAFAKNFDNDEIVEAINYAHLRNVKIFITLNTLLNEYEIENAYKQAKFYYEHNVDGLIIQDLGLFYRLRKDFPDFELHASTQMHIHNVQGVKNAKELGFKRVVIARESSLDLIKEACKQDIEVECFVHGAICVSYSGQCLMSSATKNRSANKGMCAQCCRLKYTLYKDNKKVNTDTDYLLSPKDMCLIDQIPDLIEAGVSSFKIEGRMKSSAYVGYVTKIYRKAIDAYYENKKFSLTEEEKYNLNALFNRGFTNTYLLNDSSDLFGNKRPNHQGVLIGKVVDVKSNSVFIKLSKDINQFDGIRIVSKEDTGLILNMIKVNGKLVSKAFKDEVIEINLSDKVNINDPVYITQDNILEQNINSYKDKLIPINLKISGKPNESLKVECNVNDLLFNYESSLKLDKSINHPISKNDLSECFSKVDIHPYVINSIDFNIDDFFIPIKQLNQIRREFFVKLDEYRLNSFKRNVNPSLELKDIKEHKDNLIDYEYFNNVVNTDSLYHKDLNIVSEFGGILLDGEKDGYYTLNVSNSYAYELLLHLGFNNVMVSSELDEKMINELVKAIKDRLNIDVNPLVYDGKRTLMYISRNPFKEYIDDYSNVKLSDGNNVYKVEYNNEIIELKETN